MLVGICSVQVKLFPETRGSPRGSAASAATSRRSAAAAFVPRRRMLSLSVCRLHYVPHRPLYGIQQFTAAVSSRVAV